MSGINSQWPTFHETHTITPASLLASSINGPISCGSHFATSKIGSSLMARSSQHNEGLPFTTGSNTENHSHGHGSHVGKNFIQGTWTRSLSELHINFLELEAVFLTIKHFLLVLKNKHVLIRSCQYVNRQGGTKYPPLSYSIWVLRNFALENNMHLKAAHILGSLNIFTDQLSRERVWPKEWQIHKIVVQTLFQIWGTPLIELFASKENKQTPVFCSLIPHQDALAIDALSISWKGMFAYVYPQICLIPKVLQHMEQFHCHIILIAPKRPHGFWNQDLLKFLIACPRKLPLWPDLLQQPKNND